MEVTSCSSRDDTSTGFAVATRDPIPSCPAVGPYAVVSTTQYNRSAMPDLLCTICTRRTIECDTVEYGMASTHRVLA
eukprot:3686331-Rhodomonas_salina.4